LYERGQASASGGGFGGLLGSDGWVLLLVCGWGHLGAGLAGFGVMVRGWQNRQIGKFRLDGVIDYKNYFLR